jgi:trichohyalin
MNDKQQEFEKRKNEYAQRMTMLYEQNQNVNLKEMTDKIDAIEREMKEREEKTKREIERLKKENEEAIKKIDEETKKQLESMNKYKQEKIREIREQSRLRIQNNNMMINQILNRYDFDINQLMNNL